MLRCEGEGAGQVEWEESRVRKGLAKVAGTESCRAGQAQ